jgi:hypothetical protein
MAVAMRLMIMLMHMIGAHAARLFPHHARHMLKLNGRMMDADRAELGVDALQNGIAFRRRHIVNQHMRTQRMRV